MSTATQSMQRPTQDQTLHTKHFCHLEKRYLYQLSFCCTISHDNAKKQTTPERTFSRAHTVFGAVLASAFIAHRESNFKLSLTLYSESSEATIWKKWVTLIKKRLNLNHLCWFFCFLYITAPKIFLCLPLSYFTLFHTQSSFKYIIKFSILQRDTGISRITDMWRGTNHTANRGAHRPELCIFLTCFRSQLHCIRKVILEGRKQRILWYVFTLASDLTWRVNIKVKYLMATCHPRVRRVTIFETKSSIPC
jgi:hypothetical protein